MFNSHGPLAQLDTMDHPQTYNAQGRFASSRLLEMLDVGKSVQISPFVMNSPSVLAQTAALGY